MHVSADLVGCFCSHHRFDEADSWKPWAIPIPIRFDCIDQWSMWLDFNGGLLLPEGQILGQQQPEKDRCAPTDFPWHFTGG